jgi:hypothetical protein
MAVVTSNTIQPSSGQALTIKDEGGTASITVATNGEATFAENIIVGTAGKGIDFSNASGSASGSSGALLDDYEEGSVTNPLEIGGGTVTSGYDTNHARYIKVGNAVVYSFFIDTGSNTTVGGTTGQVKVHLPFTALSSGGRLAVHTTTRVASSWVTDHMWYMEYNDTLVALYNDGMGGISRSSSSERFWLSGTFSYLTA